MSVSQWAKQTGLNRVTINRRLELGWSVERALTASLVRVGPTAKHRKRVKFGPFQELQRHQGALERELKRTLRLFIRDAERQMASVGREFGRQLARHVESNGMPEAQQQELIKHRGRAANFPETMKDRTHSTAQETT